MRNAVWVLCGVQLVDVLGVTLTTTALPAILAGLGAGEAAATPIVTAYAATFGGLLLLGARLGDRFGHRRTLLLAIALYGAASVLGALAPSVAVLVAARALQGAAAALSVPAALRLLLATAPEGVQRRRALAAWSAAGAAAGALGFLAGGVLTQAAGWRSGLWLGAVAAGLLAPAVARAVRREVSAGSADTGVARRAAAAADDGASGRSGIAPGTGAAPGAAATSGPAAADGDAAASGPAAARGSEPSGGESLDVVGGVLLTAAVMVLVLGGSLVAESHARGAGAALLAAGAVVLGVFAAQQRRARSPLLPGGALGDRRLRAGVTASALVTATSGPATTLVALELQEERGVGPAATGLLLLPLSLAVVGGAALAGRLLGCRPRAGVVAGGLLVNGLGAVLLAVLGVPLAVVVLAATAIGFGIGLASVAANATGTDVPAALQGTASGALNTAAQLGTALGTAAVLTLATVADSRTAGWAAIAAVGILAAGLAAREAGRGAIASPA